MQNEIIRLRRNENFMPGSRMPFPKKRRNPTQEQRTRIENNNDQQRQRIPRARNPNAIILEEAYDEQTIEQEADYIQEEIMFETGANPDIILGKVRRQIDNLAIFIKGHQVQRRMRIKKHTISEIKELEEVSSKEPYQM